MRKNLFCKVIDLFLLLCMHLDCQGQYFAAAVAHVLSMFGLLYFLHEVVIQF